MYVSYISVAGPSTMLRMVPSPDRGGLEGQEVDEQDVDDEQRDRGADLRLDYAILVLELEKGRRNEIEVGRHRRHQRPAETGEHADRADHCRIAAIGLNEQRNTDSRGH